MLQDAGLVHGDLANNGIYDGESIKFHDPVGTPYDQDARREMTQYDFGDIEILREKAVAPFDQAVSDSGERVYFDAP